MTNTLYIGRFNEITANEAYIVNGGVVDWEQTLMGVGCFAALLVAIAAAPATLAVAAVATVGTVALAVYTGDGLYDIFGNNGN